jgi:hypothetical protein
VIEFSYKVEGQEYHNVSGSSGISAASSKGWADARVARYPAGTEVEVFYNPENPTQSSLTAQTRMMAGGHVSLIVAAILIAVAVYAASH